MGVRGGRGGEEVGVEMGAVVAAMKGGLRYTFATPAEKGHMQTHGICLYIYRDIDA